MTYIQGYEDGINAVLEVLRGFADAAQAQSQDALHNTPNDRELCNVSCVLLRSTRETILEQRKQMLAMRRQRLQSQSERVH